MTKLSDSEQRLFDKLQGRGDVRISVLYRTITKRWPTSYVTNRQQSQKIGPYLTRLRRKLKDHAIVPGKRRHTYRLVKIND